jgi:hypothetical protein
MTSHLVTGIGELVTHDPRFDGPLLDAALVAEHGVVVHKQQQRRAGARDALVARQAVWAHPAHDLDLGGLERLAADALQQRPDLAVERGDD